MSVESSLAHPPRHLHIDLPDELAGERMDRVVAQVANISRQRAMALLADGRVRVNHRRPKKGERAEAGARLEIELPESETPLPQPELPLTVLHEDEWLVALDKPAGVNMHPLSANERGTLANAVIARYPEVVDASAEERCPGLVHRLDRETSGVVLWARRKDTFDRLRAQFSAKTVEKLYLAVVDGIVEGTGELNVPLAHDPADARRMVAAPYPAEAEELKARPAVSLYRVLAHGDDATLVQVEIPTGVMHQIRAHFSFVGYPVLGDELYGGRALPGIERHLLHAWSIGFEHPGTGSVTRIVAPLPEDFRKGLAAIGLQPPEAGPA